MAFFNILLVPVSSRLDRNEMACLLKFGAWLAMAINVMQSAA